MLWNEQRERQLEEETPERMLLLHPPPDVEGRPTEFADPASVVEQFRSALWHGDLAWEVEERDDSAINHNVAWICPHDMHCWACFMYVREKLAEIQVSLPLKHSEWKRRLEGATEEIASEFGLKVDAD